MHGRVCSAEVRRGELLFVCLFVCLIAVIASGLRTNCYDREAEVQPCRAIEFPKCCIRLGGIPNDGRDALLCVAMSHPKDTSKTTI